MGKHYKYNTDFFADKSLEACFYAGFISADGCIVENKKTGSKSLTVELKSTDRDFLEGFADALGASVSKEYERTHRKVKREYKSVRVRITNKKIIEDLEDIYNITARKSFTNIPPVNLNRQQKLAFIAGYIDGDGCYTSYKSGEKRRPCLTMMGTEDMMMWILKELSEKKKRIYYKNNLCTLQFKGADAIKARESYINLELPFMKRKFRRWESLGVNLEIK